MPHRYIPNQADDRQKMAETIGIKDETDLFSAIPDNMKLHGPLDIGHGLDEIEVSRNISKMADENHDLDKYVSFLGAGIYDHYVPSVIDAIVSRSEFYTSYTPYQPEISQGTLQAIFEYQSAMCGLTGMDISNASMYDGATALYEACSLAVGAGGVNRVILSSAVNPEYAKVVRACLKPHDTVIDTFDDMGTAEKLLIRPSSCIVVQSPNYYGIIEDVEKYVSLSKKYGCLSVIVADPLSLGILEPPGAYGADITVGDGQALGCYQSLGGPHFGFFCTTNALVRKIPGRIVGRTKDADGNDGYVLTLQAREQHIRREKASSNICSNHSLCALRALIYLSVVGREGLVKIASDCANKAQYLKDKLLSSGYFTEALKGDIFKEFAVKTEMDIDLLNGKLAEKRYIGGLHLTNENAWLLAVTEKRTYEELDNFVSEVNRICKENL
jgi:glycine dehydrogenase subunit 1